MRIQNVAALVCIGIGFFVGAGVFKLWFDPLTWFVAAIALNTLSLGWPTFIKRGQT